VVVTALLACAAVAFAAPCATSAGSPTTGSNPAAPLWRAYPLEQTATTARGSAVPSTDPPHRTAAPDPAPERGGRTPWITLVLAGIAVALSLATIVVLRRRSAADGARAGLFDPLEPSAVGAGARTAVPAAGRAGRNPPAEGRRGAGAASRATLGTHEPPAASEREAEAPALDAEVPEGTTAVPAQTAAGARAPVAPATEESAGVSDATPQSGSEGVPAAPEESAGRADTGSSAPEVVPTGPEQSAVDADSSPSAQEAIPDAVAENPPASEAPPETPAARNLPPEAPGAPSEDAEDALQAPEESASRPEGEAAPPATPARVPQREGAGASAAPGVRPRRRSSATSRPRPPAGPPGSDDPARAATSKRRPRRERPAAAQSAAAQAAGPTVPPASADDRPVERNTSRTRKVAAGPICQIRWLPKGRGSCFSAVTIDDDGIEHTLATSPRIDWQAPTPPEQTLEAEVAVRRLAKTLREQGWKPMRTKGKDYNQPQWYTRRFRYPATPAEGDRSVVGDRGASAS